jgi:glycosyltransferase involved in cell wall biosynthesis
MARTADAVLPYTERGASECISAGVAPDRIFITRNTLDIDFIRRTALTMPPDTPEARRRSLGLSPGPVFLFCGHLYAAKRVDLAIDAVRRLHAEGRACTLLIVGQGDQREALMARAAGDADIKFAPAEFEEARLAPLFALATAMVIPDAVGLAIVHGFAYGVPLVACAGGKAHGPELEYLENGVNGLTAEGLDAAPLARVLAAILDNPQRRDALAAGARRTADGLTLDRLAAATVAGVRRALAP